MARFMLAFIVLCVLCCWDNLISQCYGQNVTFSSGTVVWDGTVNPGAFSVYAFDLDNDKDMDILVALRENNMIVWFNNTDGKGSFSPAITISTVVLYAISVFASDLDNDGDLDVLSASYNDNKIAWYENMNGKGIFSSQNIISTSVSGAHWVYTADLDGDQDNDVLAVADGANSVMWFRNNGAGSFSSQIVITTATTWPRYVSAIDLDQDGDCDVLSASYGDNKIAWYSNLNGLGIFSSQIIISSTAAGAHSVFACDIDGDGDNDVLSASQNDNKIAWYKNNGTGSFSNEIVISNGAGGACSVFSIDIDGDNDLDVLSASDNDNKIAWYENLDGLGVFSSPKIITTSAASAISVYSADLDGDDDNDVVSASYADDRVIWFENYLYDCVRPADSILIYSKNCSTPIVNDSVCYPFCKNAFYSSSRISVACDNGILRLAGNCLPFSTIRSVCPDEIRVQVFQSVNIQGSGFLDDNSTRCILNRTIYSKPLYIDATTAICGLHWPYNITNDRVELHIAPDYIASDALMQQGILLTLIGACESEKTGSVAGLNGCECPRGTKDIGTACMPCENGFYQDEANQGQCLPCSDNQDTNQLIGSVSSSACVCKPAYYYDPSLNLCKLCTEGMICPGNNVVFIHSGYWRTTNESAVVIHCPYGPACSGTQNSSSSLCNVGYTGPLCTVCESGYAKMGETCIKCPSSGFNGFVLLILICLAIGLSILLIRSTSTLTAKIHKSNDIALPVLVKVFVNYLQLVYYISRLSANWSQELEVFFVIIGQSTLTPNIPPIQCAAKWSFYDRLVFIYMFPLIVMTVLLIVYSISHVIYRQEIKESLTKYQFAVMLILYQIHPTIMVDVIQSLPCQRVPGTGTSYLAADMSIDCGSSQYKTYAIISWIYLIVYILGMIILVSYRGLYHNAKTGKLFQPTTFTYRKYAFFLQGYNQETYYWEALVMLRKLVIVALSVLMNSSLQLIWACVVLHITFTANLQYVPFSSPFVNRLENISLTALYASVILGFHFLLTNSDHTWSTVLFLLINGSVMLVLLGSCLSRIGRAMRRLDRKIFIIKKMGNTENEMQNISIDKNNNGMEHLLLQDDKN